jgi:flavodoxin I
MKTAIIYSHKAVKTSQVAKQIKKQWKLSKIDDHDVESFLPNAFMEYDLVILGVSTWFDGELPHYWDEMIAAIEDLNLKGLKVAIFGNGDQIGYPENFGDAVGLLAEVFESVGATIVGHTSKIGYTFEQSKALNGNSFVGLILDFENQKSDNQFRIDNWVGKIKSEV